MYEQSEPQSTAKAFGADQLRRLTTHVSRLQLQRIAAGETREHASVVKGALLFMDVVGFTQLTLQMSRQSRQGAEKQLSLMNIVFCTVIDAAERLGGDLQFFAGDAALVLFAADESGDLADPVRRAAAAAMEIRTKLAGHEVEGRTVSVRLSIVAGDASALEVGSDGNGRLPLIAGRTLESLFALDRVAKSAGVVVSAEAWALIAKQAQGTVRSDGSVALSKIDLGAHPIPQRKQPEFSAALGETLTRYVPEIVTQSVRADLHEFVAEFRAVSVVFIGLPSLDPGNPASLAAIRTATDVIQEQARLFDGVVHEMSCDDKGTSVVAVFGLPPHAHDDDSTRAVQAASAIDSRLDPSLEPRIGVATGSVFCGLYGNGTREHYGFVGPTINRAARLMQASAGSNDILVCADTARAAARHLDFDPLPPIAVKGEDQPVEVRRPRNTQRRGTTHTTRAMIGRTNETAEIVERFRALRDAGAGGSMLIEAEAGQGKSTLLAHVLRVAAQEGIKVHTGAADPIEASSAYFPFRAVLLSVLSISPTADAQSREAAAVRAIQNLDEPTRSLGPLLRAVIPLELADNELTAQMAGAIRAENLQELLLALLKSAAKSSPYVIAIDDLHWQDTPSWGLARRVLDEIPNVFLLGTMRPMDVRPAEYASMTRGGERLAMKLGPLDEDETVEIVRRRLGADVVPVAVKRLVTARAEGNPFYAEELALALLGSGAITIESGTCRVVDSSGTLDALSLPGTVQGVITSRIDRLGPAVQLTLKVASVVGRAFDADMVRAIRPRDEVESAIREHLDTAERAELIVREGERGYSFKHALTHDTTYALMSAALKMPLHEQAAQYIEKRYSDNLTPWYGRLAHHYSETALSDKALEYLGLAGQQALDAWANAAARDYLARAIGIDEKKRGALSVDLRRANWHQKLAEAHYSLVQFDEARAHLEQAIRLCGFGKPAFGIATPWEVLRHVAGRWTSAPTPASGELRERCTIALRAADVLQVICLWKGDRLSLAHTVFEGTNIARTLGPSAESAFAKAMVGYLLMLAGMREVAERDLLAAVQMADASGALLQRCSTHMYLGMSYSALGRLPEALSHLTEADEYAGRLGAGLWKHRGKYMRAEATMMSGRLLAAAELFEWCAIYAASAEPPITGFAKAMKALCLLQAGGSVEESLAIIRGPTGIKLVRDNPTKLQLYVCLGALIECHRLDRNYAAALEAAEEAFTLAESGDDCNSFMTGYNAHSALAGLFLDLWEQRRSDPNANLPGVPPIPNLEANVRRALKQLAAGRKLFPATRTRELLHEGQYQRLAGSMQRAKRAWSEGVELAAKLRMPWEEASMAFELARASEGTERERWLQRASSVAEGASLVRLAYRIRAFSSN